MKCFRGFLIALLLAAVVVVCQANPVKTQSDDNEIQNDAEREKRQMKGAGTTSTAADQAEVKFLGVPGVMQGLAGNLQTGRQNGFMNQGAYANIPGLGYGIPGGFGGLNGIGGLPGPINPSGNIGTTLSSYPSSFGPINPNGNLGTTLSSYPSSFEMYPQFLYGNGIYPNVPGANPHPMGNIGQPIGNTGPFGPLDNAINSANMPGLNTQLIAQQSQIQPQFAPFPLMAGYYPQMGYSPAYQNFQG